MNGLRVNLQCLRFDESCSSSGTINFGVPQGSVFGCFAFYNVYE